MSSVPSCASDRWSAPAIVLGNPLRPASCAPSRCRSAVRRAPPMHWRGLLLLLGTGLLGACTTFSEGFFRVDRQLLAGDVTAALAGHEKLAYPARDRALQALNRGMLLRLNGDYAASNAALESAKLTIDDVSRLSLVEQASGLVSNDASRAYEGQVHERIYLHLIKAINYLQLDERFSARVEVLQLDVLMRDLAVSHGRAVERAAPFPRYLSGLIYDALDEPSDAMIAYRNALLAYRARDGAKGVPEGLRRDVLRLSRRLGLSEEHDRYRREFDLPVVPQEPVEHGELVAIVLDGVAPPLRENSVTWPELGGSRLFRLSLPTVGSRPPSAGSPRLIAPGVNARAELVDDLGRLVQSDLDERLPAMAARAIARQAIKQGAATAASRAAQRKADNSSEALAAGIVSIGMQFAAVLSERADTRSWSTLPERVWLIRQALPAGQHRLQLESRGRRADFTGLRIAAGEKTFIVWHPLGPGGALGSVQ